MLSETSANKNNSLNPGCGESFSKLHSIIFRMKRLGTSMKVCDRFQNGHGRKKVLTLYFSVQTRWNYAHGEMVCSISNQYDLDMAIGLYRHSMLR